MGADPHSMDDTISRVLRYGVYLSGAVITIGVILLVVKDQSMDVSGALSYDPAQIPHGAFSVDLPTMVQGIFSLDPYSVIELGIILLVGTPVSRVVASALLFAAQGDRTFVYITTGVLCLLLFSILATPFIPGFNA